MLEGRFVERLDECVRWWRGTRGVCARRSRAKLALTALSLRLAKRFLGEEFTVRILGGSGLTYIRTDSTDRFAFYHVFIERQYELDFGVARPSLIVDAGANIGLASIFFALRYPGAKIIAIEVAPENFAMLARNVAPFERVETRQAALWFRPADLRVHDPGSGYWSLRAVAAVRGSTSEVSAITVEQIVSDHGPIDILKLDIEGAERDLLLHSRSWIDSVGAIVAELHQQVHPDVVTVFEGATASLPCRGKTGELFIAHR